MIELLMYKIHSLDNKHVYNYIGKKCCNVLTAVNIDVYDMAEVWFQVLSVLTMFVDGDRLTLAAQQSSLCFSYQILEVVW